MVDWKLYIDSPQQRTLDFCGGSLTEGDAYGCGWGYIDGSGDGYGFGYGEGYGSGAGYGDGYSEGYGGSFAVGAGVGDGCGMGSGWYDDNGYCNGRSSTEW